MSKRNKEELLMKAKTKITRLFGILLAFVMVVGMLPTVALAAEESATAEEYMFLKTVISMFTEHL